MTLFSLSFFFLALCVIKKCVSQLERQICNLSIVLCKDMYCECNVEIPNYSEHGVAKAFGINPWISKNGNFEQYLQTCFNFLARLIEKQCPQSFLSLFFADLFFFFADLILFLQTCLFFCFADLFIIFFADLFILFLQTWYFWWFLDMLSASQMPNGNTWNFFYGNLILLHRLSKSRWEKTDLLKNLPVMLLCRF